MNLCLFSLFSHFLGKLLNTKGVENDQAKEIIKNKTIKKIEDSKISMMPPGLINLMKEDDVLDLLAYILSRGNKDDKMFKK